MARRGKQLPPTAGHVSAEGGGAVKSDDVARMVGVSRSTVSRAFNPKARVNRATRERIIQAAEHLGYRPPNFVEDDSRGRAIGLVLAPLENPFYQEVLTGFSLRLQRLGVNLISRIAPDIESVDESVRRLLREKVTALVITCSGLSSTAIAECAATDVPVILFNRTMEDEGVSSVVTDNFDSGGAVADLLVRAGCRRPAYINGLEKASTNRDRLNGFTSRLIELGLPEPMQEFGDYTYEGGREAARRIMLWREPPDVLFCANDISAFGALDALRCDLGLRVPDDVGVVGFDDVPMAAWPSFALTTVRQRRNQMIDETLELLDALIADPRHPPVRKLVRGRLILRGSLRLPSPGGEHETGDRPGHSDEASERA